MTDPPPPPFTSGRAPEQIQPAIHASPGGVLSVNISETTLLSAGLVWRLPYELFVQPYGERLVLISRTLTTNKSPYGHSCSHVQQQLDVGTLHSFYASAFFTTSGLSGGEIL